MDTDHGAHVDDAATPLTHHDRGQRMDEVESGFEVHGDDGIPLAFRHFQHQAVLGDTGVVDEDVDVTEVFLDLLDDRVGLLEVGGVGSIGLDLAAESLQFGDRLLGILVDDQVREGDVSTFGREFQRHCFSDSSGCSGDQGNLSV
jgi:hypothetical protein